MPEKTEMDIDYTRTPTVAEQVQEEVRQNRTEMAVDDTRSDKEKAIDRIITKMTRFNRPVITRADLNKEQKNLSRREKNPHNITMQEVIDRGLVPLHNPETLGENATSIQRASHEKFTTQKIRQQEEIARDALDTLAKKQVHEAIPQEILDRAAEKFTLSDEQRQALRHMTNGKGVAILRGPPGTGKGQVLKAVTYAYEEWAALEGKGNLKLVGVGPTHMVAQKFSEQGIEPGNRKTVHRAAKDPMMDTVVEGDEAGMWGTAQFHKVAEKAARPDANSVLLLAGDEKQLSSIEHGGVFKYALEKHGFFELNENHRQKEPWQKNQVERVSAATDANRDTVFKEVLKEYAVHGAVTWVPGYDENEAIDKAVAHVAKGFEADEPREVLAVSRLRKDVRNINRGVFDRKVKHDNLADEHIKTFRVRTQQTDEVQGTTEEHEDVKFAPGTRVQFLGTLLKSAEERGADGHILNGSFATIVGFEEYTGTREGFVQDSEGNQKLTQKPFTSLRIVAKLDELGDDGKPLEVRWDPKDFKDFDQGFASTVHKVQGQTVRDVVYVAGKSDGAEIFNVATSRNTENFHMVFRHCDGSDEQIADAGRRLAKSEDRSTSLVYETEAEHLNAIAKANAMDIEFPTPQASAERERAQTPPVDRMPTVSTEKPVAEKPAHVAQDDIEMTSPEIRGDSAAGHEPVRNLMDLDAHLSTPPVHEMQGVEMTAAGDHEQNEALEALRQNLQGLSDPLVAPASAPHNFARTMESLGSTPSESAQTTEHSTPVLGPRTNSTGSFEVVPLPAAGIEGLTNSLGSLQINEPKEAKVEKGLEESGFEEIKKADLEELARSAVTGKAPIDSDEAFKARLEQRSENRKQIAKEVAEISATQFARTVARISGKLGMKEGSMSDSDKLYVDLLAKRQEFREKSAAYAEGVHARVSAKVEQLLNPAEVAALKADIDSGRNGANDRESYKSTKQADKELSQAVDSFAKLNDRPRETAHGR